MNIYENMIVAGMYIAVLCITIYFSLYLMENKYGDK